MRSAERYVPADHHEGVASQPSSSSYSQLQTSFGLGDRKWASCERSREKYRVPKSSVRNINEAGIVLSYELVRVIMTERGNGGVFGIEVAAMIV